MDNMIEITEAACDQIADIIAEDPTLATTSLRIFVQGGGCSGMSYGFTFDEEKNEDDFTFEKKGIKIVVDSMSMNYLTGATIDFKDELMGKSFVINNPNAETTCGCGSSFSPFQGE